MRISLFFLLLTFCLEAKDYGVHGELYPITERNLIEVFKEKIDQLSDSEKQEIHQRIAQKNQDKLIRPHPLCLPITTERSVHLVDPSVTVNEDIKDVKGNVVVSKGTTHNPLSIQPLNQPLLFFDGDDNEQVLWAKSQPGMWILVRGSPLDLEEKENRPVFFDQGGVLCQKFQIKSVPARVSQEDLFLKVEMIPKGDRH